MFVELAKVTSADITDKVLPHAVPVEVFRSVSITFVGSKVC